MQKAQVIIFSAIVISLSACSSSPNTGEAVKGAPTSATGHTITVSPNPAAGPGVKGSGKLTSVDRRVGQFHAIVMQDLSKIQLTLGAPLSLSVTADDNVQDAIDTKVKNGILTIGVSKSFQTVREPYVTISVPELNEVHIDGAGEIIVDGIKGDIFNIDAPGAGNFRGTGAVINEKITQSGSGTIDCSMVKADNVKAESTGSGKCTLWAEKSLNAKLNGVGSIKYKGIASSLNKHATGGGTISPL